MRRTAGWAVPLTLAVILFAMLLMPETAINGAKDGLALWAQYVLPALLPYCILTQLLIDSGALEKTGRFLSLPARWLFRLSEAGGPALVLALAAGSPAGARIARQIYDRGLFSPDDVTRFTAAAASPSPLFLLGTVGALLGDAKAGALALCATLLAALANGLLWRFFGKGGAPAPPQPVSPKPLLQALPAAIADGCSTVVAVGGTIALFSALAALLTDSGLLRLLAAPLTPLLGSSLARPLLTGLLEMTGGIQGIASLPLDAARRAILAAPLAAFGGLSVAAQAALFLRGIVPMRLYLLQRSSHALLAFLAAIALRPLFFPAIPALADLSGFCPLCILIFLGAMLAVFGVLTILRPHRQPYRPATAQCAPLHPHRQSKQAGRSYATYYAKDRRSHPQGHSIP